MNVRQVQTLRTTIRSQFDKNKLASGINKRRLIQRTVFDALCQLVDPTLPESGDGTKQKHGGGVFKPKKGTANVVMMVGLQGSGKTTTSTKVNYILWMVTDDA